MGWVAPGIERRKATARRAGKQAHAKAASRRGLLVTALHLGRDFRPADLGLATAQLVDAVHAFVGKGWVDCVSLGGCRWVYRLTEAGRREAVRLLDGAAAGPGPRPSGRPTSGAGTGSSGG